MKTIGPKLVVFPDTLQRVSMKIDLIWILQKDKKMYRILSILNGTMNISHFFSQALLPPSVIF